ncbi:response regulator [Flavobacterium sp. Sd200]|uniref:sigma 54-interacting transcriptional regulator n=1 Tax=Flavobacterium sp. Sd200 TaxID=2692211 RepID=UPI00136EEDC3|nr:sigma 54-interacting transcriptional regulator [Flavobacterium sp. Sd200]MXN90376.1 response regulator [Flavobacterium sp. Sd200]
MKPKILIVEDQFIEAHDLQIMLEKNGYPVCGTAKSVKEALPLIASQNPGLVLVDIFLKGTQTGIDLAKILKEENRAFIFISANSNHEVLMAAKATQPQGFIVKPFREKDLLVTLEIAQYRHENSLEASVKKEKDFRKRLQEITVDKEGWEQKLLNIGKAFQPYINFDYMVAGFKNKGNLPYTAMSYLRIGFNEYQIIGLSEFQVITNLKTDEINTLQAKTKIDKEPVYYNDKDFKDLTAQPSMRKVVADVFRMNSTFTLPLPLANGEIFYFFFYSRKPDAYNDAQLDLCSRFCDGLKDAIESMLSIQKQPEVLEVSLVKEKAQPKKNTAEAREGFEGIIGRSHLLLNVFDNISQVAGVDTSVLILGESGTGKERIAESVHNLSPRKKQPLVKINCAVLPANLIESELFGHEKGAFTGAMDRRIGKFELANKGTIFLDEIGEMPLDLQAKLLRVLQEKEINRIGGNMPIKVDIRIIAATNRNLEKEVADGRFRLDLYYRLNIFPIELPSLRERKDDIPLLVDHFIEQYNQKTGKRVTGLSERAMEDAMDYSWPGNIRELENLIERGVLLAKENVIREIRLPKPIGGLAYETSENGNHIKSIDENERDHIISVLKKCRGKIWGPGGAAEMLNVPPSTLNSKMKKLGIRRELGR